MAAEHAVRGGRTRLHGAGSNLGALEGLEHPGSQSALRDLGDRRHQGIILTNLGRVAFALDDIEEGRQVYADGEELLRGFGDPFILGTLLANRARGEAEKGDRNRAERDIRAAGSVATDTEGPLRAELDRLIQEAHIALESPPVSGPDPTDQSTD